MKKNNIKEKIEIVPDNIYLNFIIVWGLPVIFAFSVTLRIILFFWGFDVDWAILADHFTVQYKIERGFLYLTFLAPFVIIPCMYLGGQNAFYYSYTTNYNKTRFPIFFALIVNLGFIVVFFAYSFLVYTLAKGVTFYLFEYYVLFFPYPHLPYVPPVKDIVTAVTPVTSEDILNSESLGEESVWSWVKKHPVRGLALAGVIVYCIIKAIG